MRLLMLDIETAPHRVYAWGLWGQDISIDQIEEPGYTLCWAAKWYGKRGVSFDSIHKSKPADMVAGIYDLICKADAVIHYNGTKFDMPTLNQEFLKHGLNPPPPYHQIDLLKTVRRQFRLPSNKLDYVARHLGIAGKHKHKGMALWKECMDGVPAAWREMERYNKQDVLLLEQVYDSILPWITGHPNVALFDGIPKQSCPKCRGPVQSRGKRHTQTQVYRRFQCTRCGSWSRERKNSTPPEMKNILVQA